MRVQKLLAAMLCVVALAEPAALARPSGGEVYMLGETPVTLREYSVAKGGGYTFFAPHSNETTAIAAAKSVIARSGGTLFWLEHTDGQRNITFTLDGTHKFAVDPNRIFSDAGARASLDDLNHHAYPPEALSAVRGLAQFILSHILGKNEPPLVGIHNNTDGAPLSIRSYEKLPQTAHCPECGNQAAAARMTFAGTRDPDDFFFVTTAQAFSSLKGKGFNAALQAWPIADDGSLSVYCERMLIPYINVEAQMGHLSQQVEMLKAVTAT